MAGSHTELNALQHGEANEQTRARSPVAVLKGKWISISLLFLAVGCCQHRQQKGVEAEPSLNARSSAAATTVAAHLAEGRQKDLLSIWRSSNSTLQERSDALNKNLPHETSIKSAIELLGNGIVSRDYGPSVRFTRSTNGYVVLPTGTYEKLWLEYETQGGHVRLGFDLKPVGATSEWRFDCAFAIPGTESGSGN